MKSKSKKEVNGIVIPSRGTPHMERYVQESGCGAMHVKSINKTEQRAMAQIEAMGSGTTFNLNSAVEDFGIAA